MATQQQQQQQQHEMVEIRLDAPRTPDQSQVPQFSAGGVQGSENNGKPYLRYYAVGPKSKTIVCPLCKEKSEAVEVSSSGIFESLNCLLSCLSCCFPIFTLSCLYTMCCQDIVTDHRKCCTKCGGHLGFYARPH
ncbi:uncharacterized protein [Musca autumnalis]|uniref:uncharacterized protein n=1 Tax=Musca autumnalis TaxID=221902 RepID=UPI003CE75B93